MSVLVFGKIKSRRGFPAAPARGTETEKRSNRARISQMER